MSPRVMCEVAWDLQRFLTPLMQLDGLQIIDLHCWALPMTHPECPQYWGKKQYSWGINWVPKRLRRLPHLPLNAPNFQNQRTQLSSLMLQVHLPLHPHPQTLMVTSPRIPEEPSIGLDLSICQSPIQTTPMTGSGCTWRRRKSCQAGGGNSGPFTIRAQDPSVTPKSKNW